jgi:hypothetical protein
MWNFIKILSKNIFIVFPSWKANKVILLLNYFLKVTEVKVKNGTNAILARLITI